MKLTDGKYQIIHLAILVVLSLIFWNTYLVYPVKLFVVMLHEMSHGLMALAFGGEIIEIQIDRNLSGYCRSTFEPGFWPEFMIASAGYLGSLIWGAFILILAVKSKRDKYITLVLGLILLGLTYFVFQTGEAFGIAATAGLGIFMILSCFIFGPLFHDLLLKYFGITSCVYVVWHIKAALIDRASAGSDAHKIGELVGVSSASVGVVWMLISIVVMFIVLRYIYKQRKIEF